MNMLLIFKKTDFGVSSLLLLLHDSTVRCLSSGCCICAWMCVGVFVARVRSHVLLPTAE